MDYENDTSETIKQVDKNKANLKVFSNGKTKLEFEDIKKIAIEKDLSLFEVRKMFENLND